MLIASTIVVNWRHVFTSLLMRQPFSKPGGRKCIMKNFFLKFFCCKFFFIKQKFFPKMKFLSFLKNNTSSSKEAHIESMEQVDNAVSKKQKIDVEVKSALELFVIYICPANHCTYWVLSNKKPGECCMKIMTSKQRDFVNKLYSGDDKVKNSLVSNCICCSDYHSTTINVDDIFAMREENGENNNNIADFVLAKCCNGKILQHLPGNMNHYRIVILH